MTALLDCPTMPKRKSQRKRHDDLVRADAELVRKARQIVADRGTTLAEYISELLRPGIEGDFAELIARQAKAIEKPKR